MARILYGVHGTGHGHAIRALTIARAFPEHQFLFLSDGTGAALLAREYPVVRCPNPETPVRRHRVVATATLISILKILSQSRHLLRQVLDLIRRFQPQVTLSDYEFFLPRAARRAGLPCLSLDNQHIIVGCAHPVPVRQLPSYAITDLAVRCLFSAASDYLVTSFFRPPTKPGAKVRLLPPLLRDRVLKHRSREEEHVVAYQGYPTFKNFIPFLAAIGRPVHLYGFGGPRREGNLRFCENSEAGFLADLASCRYVICGGGHCLISEALFYGKPVLSFPVRHAFEQFLNAFYLARLGYGQYCTSLAPRPGLISAFEARLEDFRRRLSQGRFHGNPEILALVARFIAEGHLPSSGQTLEAGL